MAAARCPQGEVGRADDLPVHDTLVLRQPGSGRPRRAHDSHPSWRLKAMGVCDLKFPPACGQVWG